MPAQCGPNKSKPRWIHHMQWLKRSLSIPPNIYPIKNRIKLSKIIQNNKEKMKIEHKIPGLGNGGELFKLSFIQRAFRR